MSVDAAPKLVAFVDGASVALWGSRVASLSRGARWAHYEKAPAVKGGRFEAVFEIFAPPGSELDARYGTPMCEVLSLPER